MAAKLWQIVVIITTWTTILWTTKGLGNLGCVFLPCAGILSFLFLSLRCLFRFLWRNTDHAGSAMLMRSSDVIDMLWACVRRWLQHQASESAFILYILRFSHQISDFTSTNQRGETTFYKRRNRFVQSQTTVYVNCVFAGFFAVIAGSFVGQLWQDNIFGVLELIVIQTYQELGYIFEDGWISVCIK